MFRVPSKATGRSDDMQHGITSKLSRTIKGRRLRRSSGALRPHRLSERPGDLPSPLFVHGGIAPTRLEAIVFQTDGLRRHKDLNLEELKELKQAGAPLWLRIQGLDDHHLIEQALELLAVPSELHPAMVETPQRTRVDVVGESLQVVTHRFEVGASYRLISEQVGIVLQSNLVLTVEEVPKSLSFPELTHWMEQLQPPPGYGELDDIFFFLVDEVLDQILPLLEHMADQLDNLEEATLRRPTPRVLQQAYEIRSILRHARAMVWPLRSQLIVLMRQSKRILDRGAIRGFREVSTHVEVIFETTELLRHQCDGVTTTYMASISNRMNQVMKVLTIISSIFVPLTFIAGVYGMNFNPEKSPWNMPELDAYYGYPICMAFMLAISLLQLFWLKKRGWFQDWTGMR